MAAEPDRDNKRIKTDQWDPLESFNLLEKPEVNPGRRQQRDIFHGWFLLTLASTVLLALVGLISFLAWPRDLGYLETGSVAHCGNSSAEAMSMGCRMEPMLYGWVPPDCFVEELSAQYTPFEDREWYAEEARENKINPASLWGGELPIVWTVPYHEQHCLFLWRKLALAVKQRRPMLDDLSLSLHHADHCADYIYRGRESPHGANYVVLGFYTCEVLPWA